LSIIYCNPLRRKPPTPNEAAIAARQAELARHSSSHRHRCARICAQRACTPPADGGDYRELPPIGAVYPVDDHRYVLNTEDPDLDLMHNGRRVCVKAPPPPDFGPWVDARQDPSDETPDDDDAEVAAGYATVGPLYEPFAS
jgi:hypothetical protein